MKNTKTIFIENYPINVEFLENRTGKNNSLVYLRATFCKNQGDLV